MRRGTNALFVLPLTKCLCAPCVFTIAKLLIGFLFNICFRWILFLVFLSFHLRLFSRRDFVFIDACVDIIDDLIEQTKGDAAEREGGRKRERYTMTTANIFKVTFKLSCGKSCRSGNQTKAQ